MLGQGDRSSFWGAHGAGLVLVVVLSLIISSQSIQDEKLSTQTNDTSSQSLPQAATTSTNKSTNTSNSSNGSEQQQFKLSCQPGEQRQFGYESTTNVWGASAQQIRIHAILRIKCMEPPTNTTLKYLAEIVTLTPDYLHGNESVGQKLAATGGDKPAPAKLSTARGRTGSLELALLQAAQRNRAQLAGVRAEPLIEAGDGQDEMVWRTKRKWLSASAAQRESQVDEVLRAEPLLEGVGDAASRMGRSLSGWFSKAWLSVRDFFGNIFTSSERSLVSRDEAFKETGIDILGQCKASGGAKSKNRNPAGLPFDESVFEDLGGPEYYIGASLDGQAAGGASYEFFDSNDDDQRGVERRSKPEVGHDELDLNLSLFNDPPPPPSYNSRTKRSSSAADRERSSRPNQDQSANQPDLNHLIRIPFVFVQSRTGRIVEVRFGSNESDTFVKNFKRHLCDLFATNLDWNKTNQNEVTPIGKHQTKYQLDSSANSMEQIKASALRLSGQHKLGGDDDNNERANRQQLVRVLASIGTKTRNALGGEETTQGFDVADGEPDEEERNPSGGRHGDPNNSGGNKNGTNSSISVLRSINTTSSIQISSKMLAPDIDRVRVRVQQVQQIDEGRLIGTAGRMSMSLVQPQQQSGSTRTKRATEGEEQVEDISDFLDVSTLFSMRLIPVALDVEDRLAGSGGARKRRSSDSSGALPKEAKRSRRLKKAPLIARPPQDPQELQRVLQEWRKQEARLQLSASNLVTEDNGQHESQQMRLDILRDQIRQRLNEEFVRNRIRRALVQQQLAQVSENERVETPTTMAGGGGGGGGSSSSSSKRKGAQGDIGLGLTQLVLGSGVTSKRKGSIYGTIVEVLALEANLAEDLDEVAISRLLRDTIKTSQLRQHCKSSIPSLDELYGSGARSQRAGSQVVERRLPFGVSEEDYEANGDEQDRKADIRSRRRGKLRSSIEAFERRNDKRLEQCQSALQLMLRLNDRQAIELLLDLMDECNQRLVDTARQEELGYGPAGKFYRRLRQSFIEMLNHITRPNEVLLNKLLARLYYPKLQPETSPAPASSKQHRAHRSTTPEPEFVYVSQQKSSGSTTKYNKSLLKDEDDFNNNDASGLLVMSITSLAAKSSISRTKRVEIVDKLLQSMRGTTCSLFNTPHLDIIESMSNFQEPLDEMVGRILSLSRRCKHQDQYLVASIHGLSGQLQHVGTQRFLVDLLKSQNSTCTVKSEIVLTLIGAQLNDDLKQALSPSGGSGEQSSEPGNKWPNSPNSSNKLDETLLELMRSHDKQREPDRRCLRGLVEHYMWRRSLAGGVSMATGQAGTSGDSRSEPRRPGKSANERGKRAILKDQTFWDEAQCRRWAIPADGQADLNPIPGLRNLSSSSQFPNDELETNRPYLLDEIDDQPLAFAMANNRTNRSTRGGRRHQRLIERELEPTAAGASASPASDNRTSPSSFLRRRHKCTATKDFGPKNAQASLRTEIVNDLVGSTDENKFNARFMLAANFLGHKVDIGRMSVWHQRRTTRAYANILGRNIWDSSHGCKDKPPSQALYMPLFDLSFWLVKISVGLRLNAEMGFYPNCDQPILAPTGAASKARLESTPTSNPQDELQLYPSVSLRAAGEATAKLLIARAGMSLASHYSYQGDIRVSRQPESCMSVYSSHQPMNVTFSSWFQLWDQDCHFWGSRGRAEPQAIKWRLTGRKPIAWLEDECLMTGSGKSSSGGQNVTSSGTRGETGTNLEKIDP